MILDSIYLVFLTVFLYNIHCSNSLLLSSHRKSLSLHEINDRISFSTYKRVEASYSMKLNMSPLENTPFESLYTMVKAREACPPQVCVEQLVVSLVRQMNLPDVVIHWGHPIAMLLAIISMGGYGVYQGYLIRRKGKSFAEFNASKNARSLHPTIMSALTVIMFIGAQGGLSSLLVQQRSILESSHSATALLVLLMFFIQGSLSLGMSAIPAIRSIHSYFGIATIFVLFVHIYTGFNLGISI